MTNSATLCDAIGLQEPSAGSECREAVNSQGRSCRKCHVECYRGGWEQARVNDDNTRLCGRAAPLSERELRLMSERYPSLRALLREGAR